MSFFLASVPAGTKLYHGTSREEPVTGTEWLAFEPEHALIFARPRQRPGPPPGEGDGEKPPYGPPPVDGEGPMEELLGPERDEQQPLGFHGVDEDIPHGWLHTYVPKHALRLLYIDGLSAGKTSNGTLDTQDMLILNLTDTSGPMGGEMDRARGMCNLTMTLWEGKIDGILRMEGGFEIILCDFEAHVERTEMIAVTREDSPTNPGHLLGGWQYIKAITSRYHGIGGNRVSIDYQNFVSVFDYPDIENLFTNDVISDYAMPRLQNVKDVDRLRVKADVTKMILDKDWDDDKEATDWQAVADTVVERYSKPLHYLHTNEKVRNDKELLAAYILNLLRPFIDNTARNATLETQRCTAQFIDPIPHAPELAAPLAHHTIYAVTRHICDTLLTSLSIASSPTPHSSFTSVYAAHAVELIDELYTYLRWTTWKECKTCDDEEVCFIPIWPMGNHEDHAEPRCLDNAGADGRTGYWGERWGPRPPPGKGGREKGKGRKSEGRGKSGRE
ncbi:hypothetical protein IQ07DRAFT_518517 [Pyrenochaeta sp. DS3sAY3a]|nr:hypothetical protein IQ07DRAFT_518517 [Pyrenochaeta sp. DS3sAY3a]